MTAMSSQCEHRLYTNTTGYTNRVDDVGLNHCNTKIIKVRHNREIRIKRNYALIIRLQMMIFMATLNQNIYFNITRD